MKKLFSFLCLLMLGAGMSMWATTLPTPTECKLVRIGETNNFSVTISNNSYNDILYLQSLTLSTFPNINGQYSITATEGNKIRENDGGTVTLFYKPYGNITFTKSGSKYSVQISCNAYQSNGELYTYSTISGTFAIPVTAYESDGTTPITLTDEGSGSGSGESGSGESNTYNLTFKWKDLAVQDSYTFKEWIKYDCAEEFNEYRTAVVTFSQGYAANGNSINTNNPALTLYIIYNQSSDASVNRTNYGNINFPQAATYNVETDVAKVYYPQLADFGTTTKKTVPSYSYYYCDGYGGNYYNDYRGNGYNAFLQSDGNTWNTNCNSKVFLQSVNAGGTNFSSGSLTIESGVHGYPYMHGTLQTANGHTVNLTIDAKYVYNIVANSNDNTLGTAEASSATVTEGGSIELKATETGGAFLGWSLDGGTTIIDGTNDKKTYTPTLGANAGSDGQTFTYTAVFQAVGGSYAINYGVSPAGAGTFTQATYGGTPGTTFSSGTSISGGESVTLAVEATSGYRFDKWNDNVSTTSRTFTVSKEENLVAQFIKTYTISTACEDEAGNATNKGSITGGGTYDANTNATLTAISNDEHLYYFDHWEKDGVTISGGATITPTVTASATYTAVFRNAHAGKITAATNNASYGTASASPSGNQPGGTAVTLTVTPNSGYMFVQWEDGNTEKSRTVYVDGNKEYVANFTVETASWANYSYDNAQDIIQRDIYQESNAACEAYYSPAGQKFVEVIAVNQSRSTKNYLQLYFKTTTTNYTYPDGEIGPTPGTYLANSGVGDRITSAVVPCEGYVFEQNLYFWNWNSWPYECVIGYSKDNTAGLGENKFSAFLADVNYSSQDPSPTNTYQIGSNNFRIIVDTGKDGHMYLQVRRVSNNELLVNIGEPAQPYTLAWDANGKSLTGGTAAGSINEGTSITAPTSNTPGYTVSSWLPAFTGTMPSNDVTYVAQWSTIPYTITYKGLEDATNSNPTSYNVETETITLANPGKRDGYIFVGWKDENDNTITQIAKGSTGDLTLTATWNIELCENCDNAHYNTFKLDYDGETVNVTYPRQFSASKWSTMCLPFSLDLATMMANKMYGCVYEFKYATGNANVGSGVNLYFSNATSIDAGKCYIVNANAELADKTSFVFIGVTIDLSKDNGADLSSPATPEASIAAYNALPGYKSEGTIELVGTLRNGTLQGTKTGNKYMGLKENKIYYPNISQGSTIWAYRGIFRSSSELNIEKMRIIVDGEDRGELIIDADGDILAPSDAPSRKFIENGVLYIEREGVIYNAQGKRIK